jgi:hypothetical protein
VSLGGAGRRGARRGRMNESESRREDRLRRKARRQGLRLVKSRDRNPEIPGDGLYMNVYDRNHVVAGGSGIYGIDLDAVEAALGE